MVVEDDRYIQLLIIRKLQSAGYVVRASDSGAAALALVLQAPPQIVLLDIMLPDMDGLDVCRAIKTQLGAQSPPVIIVSARGQSQDVADGRAAGADDYLIKPFAPADLLARVQHLTRHT